MMVLAKLRGITLFCLLLSLATVQQTSNDLWNRFKSIRRNHHRSNNEENSRLLATENEFPHEFVHVIRTRFQQNQGNLTHLGLARLKLFETFCLPTILAQDVQHPFLWIIYTDPDLHESVKRPLLRALNNQSNILLVPSNEFPTLTEPEPSLLESLSSSSTTKNVVWSGDHDLFLRYHRASQTKPVVDTRLDADDGLARTYLRTIQDSVQQDFLLKTQENDGDNGGKRRDYKVYCVKKHQEWHASPPKTHKELKAQQAGKSPLTPDQSPLGYLVTLGLGANTCITPGLTFVYGVGVGERNMAHSRIPSQLPPCNRTRDIPKDKPGVLYGDDQHPYLNAHCWQHIFLTESGAVRVRSATSTGMTGVSIPGQADFFGMYLNATEWTLLEQRFGVKVTKISTTKLYLANHLSDVAADNLAGQCQRAHSCKQNAKDQLQTLSNLTTTTTTITTTTTTAATTAAATTTKRAIDNATVATK